MAAAHLKGIPAAFTLQFLRSEDFPNESLGIIDGVVRIGIGQLQALVAHVHAGAGEGDDAGDAAVPVLVRDDPHVPAPGQEHADGAVGGAEVDPDHPGGGHGQILLCQVAG